VNYSTIGGLSNMARGSDEKNNAELFGEAFLNQSSLGAMINWTYPVMFNLYKKTSHYRLLANTHTTVQTSTFLLRHFLLGTENPIETMLPVYLIGYFMANKKVSDDLDEMIAARKTISEVKGTS
jgi:hypothetical protein